MVNLTLCRGVAVVVEICLNLAASSSSASDHMPRCWFSLFTVALRLSTKLRRDDRLRLRWLSEHDPAT